MSQQRRPPRGTAAACGRKAIGKESFAVLSYVTPAGEPRSSGVMYGTAGRRLYVVTAPDSWKARHIADGGVVAVTIPIRRDGVLSLVAPIPPATVSCHARAVVHPAGPFDVGSFPKKLASLLPEQRRAGGVVFELVPEGTFVTYGLGVTLKTMPNPSAAQRRVPVLRIAYPIKSP